MEPSANTLTPETPNRMRCVSPAHASLMAAPPVTANTLSPERPFLSLPLHLVAEILAALGDVQHLPSALLTHPIFYAAYKDFPSLVHSALRTQIVDDEIYTLALITYESDPARRAKQDVTAADFLATYRDNAANIIASHRYIRLFEGLRLGEFHTCVSELRDSLVDRTLRRLNGITDVNDPLPSHIHAPSPEEARRIDRALYRYQIYCNLFSEPFRNGSPEIERKRIFFDKHSSWVNEQLGCVHDFLESELQLAIDRVGMQSTQDSGWLRDGSKGARNQHYLSLGIPWLHQLITTTSVEEQFAHLSAAKNFKGTIDEIAPKVPPTPSFERRRSYASTRREPPSDWHEKTNRTLLEHDKDDGPEALWNEVHATGGGDMFFFVDHEFALRRLGYVMWDRERTKLDACAQAIRTARADNTPTFLAPGRLMNPARSWDKQFRRQAAAATSAVRPGRRVGGARAGPGSRSSSSTSVTSASAAASSSSGASARPAPAPRSGGRAVPAPIRVPTAFAPANITAVQGHHDAVADAPIPAPAPAMASKVPAA